ncbi:MAG: hypothetical protein GX774_17080 [Armatimonadetes bacterium]|nr:hypothetical protein [Armatimonadota bacterium]
MNRSHRMVSAIFLSLTVTAGTAGRALAEPVQLTKQHVQTLLPQDAELPGFTPVLFPMFSPHLPVHPLPGAEVEGLEARTLDASLHGVVTRIDRGWENGPFELRLSARIWDSEATARAEVDYCRRTSSVVMDPGGPMGPVGDWSWSLEGSIFVQAGRFSGVVIGGLTREARRAGERAVFPPALRQALAHAFVVRASRIPEVSEVKSQAATVEANSKRLPQGAATLVCGQVYVRPLALAAALGWQSEWDAERGVLTLRHPQWPATKKLVLPAVPGQVEESVTVPLWIDQGQPLMTLADLAQAIGGRLTAGADGIYRVTR